MWDCTRKTLASGTEHFRPLLDGRPVAYAEILDLWRDDAPFRDFFTALLAASPFAAFRWETPPVSAGSAGRDFEFVLHDAPHQLSLVDPHSFAGKLAAAGGESVAAFPSLGGGSLMIVPQALAPDPVYSGLASFVRGAPAEQAHALWRRTATELRHRLDTRPTWLSTAGGGVAWLHVRLDPHPKYYWHAPYREPPPDYGS